MRASADHAGAARPGRFGILLPETDEIAAINYVERVREACDLWLESGAIALRLSIGWASPGPDTSLAVAIARAQERMFAEQRRAIRLANDVDLTDRPPAHDLEGVGLVRA